MDKLTSQRKSFSTSFSGLLIPFFVLVVSIGVTLWIWNQTKVYLTQQSSDRFNAQITDITEEINKRFTIYTNGIYGVRGLFEASHSISLEEWSRYILNLNIPQNYPGATNISFIRALADTDKNLFLQEVKTPYVATAAAYYQNIS